MRIWIDLSNSPHALLFEPIVEALRADGHVVLLTARDNAQTVELARARWPEVEIVGGESPHRRIAKAATLAGRIAELARWSRAHDPDVALSHNSYAQIVAAKATGVAIVTAMDYEHQPANHLAFRLARIILLPEALRALALSRQGATADKARYYPGLKEELYLGRFTPDETIRKQLGVGNARLVVARTPPSRALYHRTENPLFVEAIRAAAGMPETRVVVLARHREQRDELHALGIDNLIVPEFAIDTRSLMFTADLLIGAGGTMTREAALLGVPTVSVFAGKPSAVDTWLEQQGMLSRLTSSDEIERACTGRADSDAPELRRRSDELLSYFIAAATLADPPRAGFQTDPRATTVATPA